jgi:hypothetical protein
MRAVKKFVDFSTHVCVPMDSSRARMENVVAQQRERRKVDLIPPTALPAVWSCQNKLGNFMSPLRISVSISCGKSWRDVKRKFQRDISVDEFAMSITIPLTLMVSSIFVQMHQEYPSCHTLPLDSTVSRGCIFLLPRP